MADITGSQVVFVTDVEVEDSPGASVVVISGLAIALLFLGLMAVVAMLVRTRRRRPELSAKEILDRRLASGEITPDRYRELRAVIDPPSESPPASEGIASSD